MSPSFGLQGFLTKTQFIIIIIIIMRDFFTEDAGWQPGGS